MSKYDITYFHDMKSDNIVYNSNKTNKSNDMCGNEYPNIPTRINNVRRIIAIGDIHGDLDLAFNFLKVGKLIEVYDIIPINKKYIRIPYNIEQENVNELINNFINGTDIYKNSNNMQFKYITWIGKDSYVVQVGDQIDRCRPLMNKKCDNKHTTFEDENSDITIMYLFDELNKLANDENGKIFSLIGNHEILNFDNNYDYVSYRGINEIENRKKVFDKMRKKVACTRLGILVIGEIGFVHGGLALLLAKKYTESSHINDSLSDVNRIIKEYIFYRQNSIMINKDNNNVYKKYLYDSNFSPLWYRKMGYLQTDNFDKTGHSTHECKKLVDPVFKTFKLSNLIIGHTPQFGVNNQGINSACDKKVFRVDIGASRAFENIIESEQYKDIRKPQVLEILYINNEYTFNILK
jgi:hypothetical protein